MVERSLRRDTHRDYDGKHPDSLSVMLLHVQKGQKGSQIYVSYTSPKLVTCILSKCHQMMLINIYASSKADIAVLSTVVFLVSFNIIQVIVLYKCCGLSSFATARNEKKNLRIGLASWIEIVTNDLSEMSVC